MKLYIPALGDTLILYKDWEFNLYKESRNSGIYYLFPDQIKPVDKSYKIFHQKYRTNRFPPYNLEILPPDFNLPNSDKKFYYGINSFYEEELLSYLHKEVKYMGYEFQENTEHTSFSKVKFPEGTVLTIDRIYIRKNQTDFDSVSFFYKGTTNNPSKKKPRFWAKLEDVNTMEITRGEGFEL